MKGYYLFAPVEKENAGADSGVQRKVQAQCRALNEWLPCTRYTLPPVEYTGTPLERIRRRLPFTAAWRRWKYKGEFDDADFLYIRQVYHDASFVRYLRSIRKRNPSIKIIYEIPTYPYDGETRFSVSNVAFLAKERLERKRAAKYFDTIVTFYGQKEIWGVPCLMLQNGYDFSSVQLPKRERADAIGLVSVSMTAFWHGYDRVIEGLHQYYANGGEENFVYHLVGPILPEHKSAVERYGLVDHVVFHGKLSGDSLAEVLRQGRLAIDVLGGHRKDYPVSSSLKSREYGAYGLPILTASPVDYLPEDYPYQFLAPYDDSPLDMEAVLRFYHRIYDGRDPNLVAHEIRSYAQQRCDMKITMQPVAAWLMGKNREEKCDE